MGHTHSGITPISCSPTTVLHLHLVLRRQYQLSRGDISVTAANVTVEGTAKLNALFNRYIPLWVACPCSVFTDAGHRRIGSTQTAYMDEVCSPIVHWGKSDRPTAVVLSDGLGQARQVLRVTIPSPVVLLISCSGIATMKFGGSAEGVQVSGNGEGGASEQRKPQKWSIQRIGSVAIGQNGCRQDRRWSTR